MTTSPKPFAESGALIVGGTAGVGLETARQLSSAGVRRIIVVGRNRERGEAAAAEVKGASFRACDANDPAQCAALAQTVEAESGPIDILVNTTAPEVLPALFFNQRPEEMARALREIALPPIYMCAAVLPFMRERRSGAIINLASDAAKAPTPGETVMGAAMAAISMFTRTLAMEVKRDGVRANVITPSLVEGTLTGDRILKEGFSAKLFSKAATLAHLGVAKADDVAALAVFLASPAAAKITGQAVSVNGGISAA